MRGANLIHKHFIRSQEEILDRIVEAIQVRGDKGDEVNEYMKQAKFIPLSLRSVYEDVQPTLFEASESIESISNTAVRYLPYVLIHSRRCLLLKVRRDIAFYRAWKWLLGHTDADEFADRCALEPHETYSYLAYQMASGRWARLTKEAQLERHSEHAKTHTSSTSVSTS